MFRAHFGTEREGVESTFAFRDQIILLFVVSKLYLFFSELDINPE